MISERFGACSIATSRPSGGLLSRQGGRIHDHEFTRGDPSGLDRLIRETRNVDQQDRYRSVAMAVNGSLTLHIVDAVGRPPRFVQPWVYACRDGGIRAISGKPRPGRR